MKKIILIVIASLIVNTFALAGEKADRDRLEVQRTRRIRNDDFYDTYLTCSYSGINYSVRECLGDGQIIVRLNNIEENYGQTNLYQLGQETYMSLGYGTDGTYLPLKLDRGTVVRFTNQSWEGFVLKSIIVDIRTDKIVEQKTVGLFETLYLVIP